MRSSQKELVELFNYFCLRVYWVKFKSASLWYYSLNLLTLRNELSLNICHKKCPNLLAVFKIFEAWEDATWYLHWRINFFWIDLESSKKWMLSLLTGMQYMKQLPTPPPIYDVILSDSNKNYFVLRCGPLVFKLRQTTRLDIVIQKLLDNWPLFGVEY